MKEAVCRCHVRLVDGLVLELKHVGHLDLMAVCAGVSLAAKVLHQYTNSVAVFSIEFPEGA